ncbi:MAG TPA: ABC transporter substrate-binding protein [Candidatus Lustribacter sp.]|nr:ABC transporter substrate-binding protein [Candidatus Lustribacter sp.]
MIAKLVARLLVAVMVALALSGPATAQAKPYTINVILSLTGTAASLGADELTALTAYEKLANRQGGINGTPVHFQVYDDQSTAAVAVQLANTILATHPAVVMGSSIVGPTQAIEPFFKDGPVLFACTPLLYPDRGSYVFAAGASSRHSLAAAVRYFRMRGLTKIAVLVTADASGQDNLHSVDLALQLPENKNVTVVDRQQFGLTDISATSQLTHIKASGAQVLFAYPTGAPFGTALHAISDVGLNLPMDTAGPNINPVLLERFKAFLPTSEMVIANASFFNRDRKANDPLKAPIDEFYTELAAAGVKPTVAHAFTWDPARIIITALRKLGTGATPAQIRDFISNLHDFPGVSGMYDFRIGDQHGLTQDAEIVIRYDPASPTGQRIVSEQGGAPLSR